MQLCCPRGGERLYLPAWELADFQVVPTMEARKASNASRPGFGALKREIVDGLKREMALKDEIIKIQGDHLTTMGMLNRLLQESLITQSSMSLANGSVASDPSLPRQEAYFSANAKVSKDGFEGELRYASASAGETSQPTVPESKESTSKYSPDQARLEGFGA